MDYAEMWTLISKSIAKPPDLYLQVCGGQYVKHSHTSLWMLYLYVNTSYWPCQPNERNMITCDQRLVSKCLEYAKQPWHTFTYKVKIAHYFATKSQPNCWCGPWWTQ